MFVELNESQIKEILKIYSERIDDTMNESEKQLIAYKVLSEYKLKNGID